MNRSLEDLRLVAIAAARAGADTVTAWTADLATEVKGLGDYVTAADRASEASVLAVLREATPEVEAVGEESGGVRAERMWVVDPIDGTTNFLRGFATGVGVSVGLMESGRPLVGAVIAPRTGEIWSAARGQGAHTGEGVRLAVRPCAGAGVVTTGFPFRRPENRVRYLPVLAAALEQFEDLRRPGTASLDCANVARGVWDGYFELGLSLWDIAAGALLVTEAGGVVTDWAGDELEVFNSGDILAGSPECHERLLGLVREAAPLSGGAS